RPSGQCLVWNAGAGQWQPQTLSGGGGVATVFGRIGAVTAQSGDYSFGQISGLVSDSQIATGINAGKIGSGSVSNAALGYLANVTSDVQAQLNTKTGTSFGLTGDLSGTLAHATVGAIQSRSISSASPANGQVLAWNMGANQWEPQSVSGGASAGSYSSSFSAQTTVTIPGAVHHL